MTERKTLGCLVLCGDRRFFPQTERAFMEKTGLGPNDFWRNAIAGGAGKVVEENAYEIVDHAVSSGATIIGWQMHGNHCGGYPDLDDSQLREKLGESIIAVKARYPDVRHLGLWAEIVGEEIKVEVWEA